MQEIDFFRIRIDAMINLNDPLAGLATRLPWIQIETALAAKFEHQNRAGEILKAQAMFCASETLVGAGRSNAGRPKLPIRLMARLLYLKHSFNLNDEGLELLLKATIDKAVAIEAVKPKDRERVIVDTTVQEKAIAHPVDFVPAQPKALSDLSMWLECAERIRTQQRHSKNKLYALHAPEVECIGKGKVRKPYEFGVKSAVVVSHQHGLMLGARTFPGNPYDGHILSAVLEQATKLTQDLGLKLKHIVVDLGFRGVDAANPDREINHRGKFKSLSAQHKGWLKRRTAVEPAIGHLKSVPRMDRCWLQGALGDALHSISCAAGYNLRWLLRAIARLGIGAVFLRLWQAALSRRRAIGRSYSTLGRVWMESLSNWSSNAVVKKQFLVTPCRVLFENRILHGRLCTAQLWGLLSLLGFLKS